VRSVLHHGRSEGNWALLSRQWRSRYLDGGGELLRAALGRPYFFRAVATQRHLLLSLLIWLGLLSSLALLGTTAWPLYATACALVGLIVIRAVRIGSLSDACFGQIVWQVTALAMVRGFCTTPRNPLEPIHYLMIAPPQTR
jgi:hypothetical protein